MYSSEFDFNTKVYIEEKPAKPIIRKISKVFLIILILLTLLEIWLEGFSFSAIKPLFIPFVFLAYVFNNTKGSGVYKDIQGKILWNNELITYIKAFNTYYNKTSIKNHIISIEFKDITKVEYNKNLKILNIEGYTKEEIIDMEGNEQIVENKKKNTEIFIEGKAKRKLMEVLSKNINKEISYIG